MIIGDLSTVFDILFKKEADHKINLFYIMY